MKLGDVGTQLKFLITNGGETVSLVDATVKFRYKTASSDVIEKNCVIVDPPTDGVVTYDVQSGDFPEIGLYYMELVVSFLDGKKFTSSRVTQKIEDVI